MMLQRMNIFFLKLCEDNLSTKPVLHRMVVAGWVNRVRMINRGSCLSTWLPRAQQPNFWLKRKDCANLADDLSVANNVYINPDLSSAELQLTFERRKAKRESRRNPGNRSEITGINREPEPHLMSTSMPSGQYSPTTMPNNSNSNNNSSKEQHANTTRTVVNSSFRKQWLPVVLLFIECTQ